MSLGHLLTPRCCNSELKKFSIGFPPKNSPRFPIGERILRLVRFHSGSLSLMIDESMGFESNVGRTSTLGVRSKPACRPSDRDAGRDYLSM